MCSFCLCADRKCCVVLRFSGRVMTKYGGICVFLLVDVPEIHAGVAQQNERDKQK